MKYRAYQYGLDESFDLGKCSRCRKRVAGKPPRAGFPDLAVEMQPHHWVTVEFAVP